MVLDEGVLFRTNETAFAGIARSWTVNRAQIEARSFDLKAVNPHRGADEDPRTSEQLLDLIEAKGREVAEALAALRELTSSARTNDVVTGSRSTVASGKRFIAGGPITTSS